MKRVPANGNRAFSLIELLVVIAIITLLVAILFPVFATARENSRESVTMQHLEQIQSALALYKLDNQAYPQVLFGYAVAGKPMSDSADIAANSAAYGCLFPTYVNDFHVFMSEDDPNYNELTTVNLYSTEVSPGTTTLGTVARSFYIMDAFDVSPQIANLGTTNQLATGTTISNPKYVIRYQRDWTTIVSSPTSLSAVDYNNYVHQLRWQNPPGDTYVTSTTYHIPNANKIIVLFQSGTVKKIDPTQLTDVADTGYSGYDDSTSCTNSAGLPITSESCTPTAPADNAALTSNPAKFWKIANSQ